MEDQQIIELYWNRHERAIAETQQKYGRYCRRIAESLLSPEDAEECVNDAYYRMWNLIPPERPRKLRAWLGKLIRNMAIDRWRKDHAQKRFSAMEEMLGELEDCVPSPRTVENEVEDAQLGEVISQWLLSLTPGDRVLFVRRYWYGIPLNQLARQQGITCGALSQKMHRLRLNLKSTLEKEGITL